MRRRYLGSMMALMLSTTMLLGGCGSKKQEATDSVPAESSAGEATESVAESTEEEKKGEVDMSERITLSVLTTRNNAATTDVTELWWFQHLSDKFNVDFKLTQTENTGETVGLMFSTADMYDIVWGIALDPKDAVKYGDGEGLIMDWTEYLNEDMMPNTYATMQENPDAFTACTTESGKIYGLPSVYMRGEYAASGSLTNNMRIFINEKDLEACNLQMPETMDEFLDALRTLKAADPNGAGKDYVPFLSIGKNDKAYFWASLGYVGTGLDNWGTSPAVKDGEIYLPCYTEDYKEFVKIWHTMYEEGLISQDYFDSGINTNAWRSLMSQGLCSVMADGTTTRLSKEDDPDYYKAWIGLAPVKAGTNDKVYASLNTNYQANVAYVSNSTEYKDRIAKMMDYCFSPEGYSRYSYGPMKGSDECTDTVAGWYFDENGAIISGKDAEDTDFVNQYIRPTLYGPGSAIGTWKYVCELAGQPYTEKQITKTDALTGKEFTVTDQGKYTDPESVDACWRYVLTDAWKDNLTTVALPELYLSEEDMTTLADLKTVFDEYVATETAGFIVGTRSLDTVDDFIAELKKMGADELLELYREGYSTYMNTLK